MRVVLSKSAASWLRTEMHYLQQRNTAAAKHFAARIAQARLVISAHPEAGPVARSLPVPGARTFVIGDYLLDYLIEADRIVIVTIRHGRMRSADLPLEADPED
ncbi:MAG: type II toxin-antitoxin system RelE/ParE family toxin [Rhizobium sp.]|nr:type II toxin-antitoxin system RelE/ParE family toxin [Rhizobium sp.]